MIDRYDNSSTKSPHDSLLGDPNVHHTEPLRPPRSNAPRLRISSSQKEAPIPATLTAEALARLPSTDKNEAAAYKIARVKDFLHRLPDPEDPSNSPPDTDLDILEAEYRNHYYDDDDDDDNDAREASIPSTPTLKGPNTPRKTKPQPRHYTGEDTFRCSPTCRPSTVSSAIPSRRHHTPLFPQDMHLWYRFQNMQAEEPYAEFWRHRASLTLRYDKDQKVALFVGVDTKEHARKIHGHMLWLRDKWLGTGTGLFYHVLGFEGGEAAQE